MAGAKSRAPDSRRARMGGAAIATSSRRPAAPIRRSRKAPAGSGPTRREKRKATTTAHTPRGTAERHSGSWSRKSARRRRGEERGEHEADEGRHAAGQPPLGRGPLRDQPVRGAAHEQGERRDAGEDVARQLGAGEREEGERQRQPEQHEEIGARGARRDAEEGRHGEPRPGEEPGEEDGHVVPEGAGVVVDGRREPLDVVVEDEDVDEVAALVEEDRDVPGQGDERERGERGRREQLAQPAPPPRGGQTKPPRTRSGRSRPSGPLARVARPAAAAAATTGGARRRRAPRRPARPTASVTVAASSMSIDAARP